MNDDARELHQGGVLHPSTLTRVDVVEPAERFCELAQPIPGGDCTYAEQFAGEIVIAFEHGSFDRAAAVIDRAKRLLGELRQDVKSRPLADRRAMYLATLGVGNRTATMLANYGIHTAGDAERLTRDELYSLPRIAGAMVAEIEAALRKIGLSLRE